VGSQILDLQPFVDSVRAVMFRMVPALSLAPDA
jgi:hypothetical protein